MHTQSQDPGTRFLGAREVEHLTSISRYSLWRMERESRFPRSMLVGSRRFWIEAEVHAWMAAQVKGRTKPNVKRNK